MLNGCSKPDIEYVALSCIIHFRACLDHISMFGKRDEESFVCIRKEHDTNRRLINNIYRIPVRKRCCFLLGGTSGVSDCPSIVGGTSGEP